MWFSREKWVAIPKKPAADKWSQSAHLTAEMVIWPGPRLDVRSEGCILPAGFRPGPSPSREKTIATAGGTVCARGWHACRAPAPALRRRALCCDRAGGRAVGLGWCTSPRETRDITKRAVDSRTTRGLLDHLRCAAPRRAVPRRGTPWHGPRVYA
eukprot:gene14771-biopygen6609